MRNPMIYKQEIPLLGVGLNYRPELREEIIAHKKDIDFLEIIPDNLPGKDSGNMLLEEISGLFPIVCHEVGLSLGSLEPLKQRTLAKIREFSNATSPVYLSEHLSMTEINGMEIGHLTPILRTREILHAIVSKIQFLKQYYGLPFLIENITYYFQIPGSEYTEERFISEILERADCGMLMDVNNLYINAQNFHFDPIDYLEKIPLHRIVELHIGGHINNGDLVIDTHGHAVSHEVWELAEYICKRIPVRAIVLERDQNFPDFKDILFELKTAKNLLNAYN